MKNLILLLIILVIGCASVPKYPSFSDDSRYLIETDSTLSYIYSVTKKVDK